MHWAEIEPWTQEPEGMDIDWRRNLTVVRSVHGLARYEISLILRHGEHFMWVSTQGT